MADDIVTRLRAPNAGVLSSDWDVMRRIMLDAATEIERLRQEADLKGSRLDDALDEIERLHAEINSLVSAQSGWGRVPKLEAEIERLRAAGDTLVAAIRNHDLREEHIKAWEARRG